MSGPQLFFVVTAVATLAYFAALNGIYGACTVIAARSLRTHLRRRAYTPLEEAFDSPFTPGISVLLPAYNEAAGIVQSIHSLLAMRYPLFEVVAVNDGSADNTVEVMKEAFDLVPIHRTLRTVVETKPVRATYISRRHPNLVFVDKENGGKADSLNVGVNVASHPYICAIDADSLIEPDALLGVAAPILDDPEHVVATGGIVRIANGCTIDHGHVVRVQLPKSRVAVFQVVEYFRAFLVGRVGWTRINALLIISGAFGLFLRDAVEEVGGYWTDTVGEDVELVVRIHRRYRELGLPYRIEFVPDPVCWTEAPEDLRTLSRQRRRWQRGLGRTLWRHRSAIFRPRYGSVGLVALPYFFLFEFLGPVVELVGPPVTIVAFVMHDLSLLFLVAFLVIAFLLGIVLTTAALAIEEFGFRRHTDGREMLRMLWYAVAENFGYRQLNDIWRIWAFIDLARRKKGWGTQVRRGIGQVAES